MLQRNSASPKSVESVLMEGKKTMVGRICKTVQYSTDTLLNPSYEKCNHSTVLQHCYLEQYKDSDDEASPVG